MVEAQGEYAKHHKRVDLWEDEAFLDPTKSVMREAELVPRYERISVEQQRRRARNKLQALIQLGLVVPERKAIHRMNYNDFGSVMEYFGLTTAKDQNLIRTLIPGNKQESFRNRFRTKYLREGVEGRQQHFEDDEVTLFFRLFPGGDIRELIAYGKRKYQESQMIQALKIAKENSANYDGESFWVSYESMGRAFMDRIGTEHLQVVKCQTELEGLTPPPQLVT